jgi:penicillin V acylase-like amidase (Ntn superfamily)
VCTRAGWPDAAGAVLVGRNMDWMQDSQLRIGAQDDPLSGRAVTLHLALDDASGDSAIVEYLDGTPRIWHDPSYAVMTNSPALRATTRSTIPHFNRSTLSISNPTSAR